MKKSIAVSIVMTLIFSASIAAFAQEGESLIGQSNQATRELLFMPTWLPAPVIAPFVSIPWKLFTWRAKPEDYPLKPNLYREKDKKTIFEVLIATPIIAAESFVTGLVWGVPLGIWQMIRWGKPGYFGRTIQIAHNRCYEFHIRFLNQAGY